MNDCPFCARIAAGEFDYGDKYLVAFQPLNPVTPGHFLVVPRRHIASALEPLASVTLGGAMRFAAILARQMNLTDCNFINSAGAAASQSVFHLHVHVVPRREGDGLHLPWTGQTAAPPQCVNPACGKTLRRRGDGSGWEGGRGLCGACYHRARDAGFTPVVPPALTAAEIGVARSAPSRARRAERFQAYCARRSRRFTPDQAARRVGLSPGEKAARRYEREYQEAMRRQVAA
jgi:histidine triad (HIT) family protein